MLEKNMKELIIIIGFAGIAFTSFAQTKTGTVKSPIVSPDSLTNNISQHNMKDYVFFLRLKAITSEIIAWVGPKWAFLIPKWIGEGHFISNATMTNEGYLFSGKDRVVNNAPVKSNDEIVLDVFHMKAKNMEQALELAKGIFSATDIIKL
jgi:hypothetical protein